MITVGHGGDAIRGRGRVVRGSRPGRQLNHVLGTEGPDDRIVATVGLEDNTVGRAESRDVDGVITGLAIDGDGVEAQAGTREVTEDLEGVAAPAPPPAPEGSTPLMRISSISLSSAMTLAKAVPPRVMTISVAPPKAAEVVAGNRIPGLQRIDAVGLAGGIAGDDEGVADGAFGAAVDDVTAIGWSRRIGVPDDRVVPGVAVDGVRRQR